MKYKCKENDCLIEMGKDKSEILISVQGGTVKTVIGLDDLNQALNLFDVVESPKPSIISNRTRIGLGYMDRLRVVFGKEIRVDIEIDTDREVVVSKTTAKTTVQPFFKPKPSKYGLVARMSD